jgi:hypothetical protein
MIRVAKTFELYLNLHAQANYIKHLKSQPQHTVHWVWRALTLVWPEYVPIPTIKIIKIIKIKLSEHAQNAKVSEYINPFFIETGIRPTG